MSEWGVYCLYDPAGRLLYVGKGRNGATDRIATHRRGKPWGGDIDHHVWVACRNQGHALRLERRYITRGYAGQKPLYNLQHNTHRGHESYRRLDCR